MYSEAKAAERAGAGGGERLPAVASKALQQNAAAGVAEAVAFAEGAGDGGAMVHQDVEL